MYTMSSFKRIENKHDVYRGRGCMENFCLSLEVHAIEMINFKKKEIKLWTNEHQKP